METVVLDGDFEDRVKFLNHAVKLSWDEKKIWQYIPGL